jgi:gentisate 1,2-dioxygenase
MNQVVTKTTREAEIVSLDDLYREAERLDVTPGWVSRDRPIFWKEPRTDFVPMHWDYKQVKDTLASAGALIDVALAERRNLILRNSFPNNNFATVKTLVCAYQMILPGEVAPSHRHSAHAMRVILDAKGSYSIVDGEKTPMESGDIVLTPGGHWHGHGHEGAEPAYWLDGLDIPSVHLMEPMFFEEHPDKYEKITSVAASSRFRFSRDSILTRLDSAKGDPARYAHHGSDCREAGHRKPNTPPPLDGKSDLRGYGRGRTNQGG